MMKWMVGWMNKWKQTALFHRSSVPDASALQPSSTSKKCGFTLVEVILVAVVITIISGIAFPYFAGSYKGNKLRTTARTITRMARFARSMAIMREEQLTVALNRDTMEIYMGGYLQQTNAADGELDQDVLSRLGYVDGGESDSDTAGIDKEVHKFLPDGLEVTVFEKDWTDEDLLHENLYMIRFYPNGQCDWFEMEIEDNRGVRIHLENDPISGKIKSEFLQ
ncbi:prepilin-type N-terminal cleavage/methylation domain-containing protein [Pontiellaceae bacterium B12219]|nr:prepilin-type N-terminal cleavage/methylation domain-containing protein [Pontiellaceae bacterium B12219]